jgi:ankyrin repeat protein
VLNLARLPFRSSLPAYEASAERLLEQWRAGDPEAIEFFRTQHPRFREEHIPWLPRTVSETEVRNAPFELADARTAIARWYDFRDWPALGDWVEAVGQQGSPVERFESAVEAVISGDTATLATLLRDDPDLVYARSTRTAPFDPPEHHATLLHYIAANGVEGYRQKTPPNAVEIARMLLEAGADPNALADMYGGKHATMSMLVSSCHPAKAGLQVPLIDALVDFGAHVEPSGAGDWASPLRTALAFGYRDAARALVRRGATVAALDTAAGLGRIDDVIRLLPNATAEERHRALAWSAQNGHAQVVRILLEAGEDPNRYNPKACHAHSTPLHQAALAGHRDVVELLVQRGARLDIKDTVWHGTPLGWAEHEGRKDIADYLRTKQAES